jgi:hypothetical protein
MIAEVSLSFSSGDDGWVVPSSAVVVSPEKIFVIRFKDKKAEWIYKENGMEANREVEVFANLDEGDQLIINANEEIRNGSEVNQTIVKQ